jgi:hypothetical protein
LHNGLQSAATLNCCPGCEFDIPVADAEAGMHKVVPNLTHSNAFQSNGGGAGAGVGTTVGVGARAGLGADVGAVVGDGVNSGVSKSVGVGAGASRVGAGVGDGVPTNGA